MIERRGHRLAAVVAQADQSEFQGDAHFRCEGGRSL
jgi:hypothetical protein